MIAGWGGGHLGDRTSALLDGQLSEEETERAWAHVHSCHVCRDSVEREGWLKSRLAGLSHDPTAKAVPDALKGTLLGAPADVFFGFHDTTYAETRSQPQSHRRAVGLAAIGGSAVGAAVMGVLAFGAAPASAPTTPLPAAAVNSAAPTQIAIVARRPAP